MILGRGPGFLPALELEIQKRAWKKDPKFILSKIFPEHFQFVRMQDGFKIFKVDLDWVNNNVSAIYGHGGHGFAHESIPLNEIWVATHHPVNCLCKNVKQDRKMSQEYFDCTASHEIDEFWDMAKGIIYKKAHQNSLKKDKKRGFTDPYAEVKE